MRARQTTCLLALNRMERTVPWWPRERIERVQRRIGTVGRSGRSFGAHLNFEVRLDGTAVDPLVFLA